MRSPRSLLRRHPDGLIRLGLTPVGSALLGPVLVGSLLLGPPALAGELIEGDAIRIHYNDGSTWNDGDAAAGLQISDGGDWVDVTWSGQAWQVLHFEYTSDGAAYSHQGNYVDNAWDWTVESVTDTSSGSAVSIEHLLTAGQLTVIKTETWELTDQVMSVRFIVTNDGAADVENLRVMHGFDPDQDSTVYGLATTNNDVRAAEDWAQAVGPTSGWAVGVGVCDPDTEDVGHPVAPGWDADADAELIDYEGATDDNTMHWRHTEALLPALGTVEMGFILAWDTTDSGAQALYDAAVTTMCVESCDGDGDGYGVADCLGYDCDDEDAVLSPGADEVCDGIDNDCDDETDEDSAVDASTWYTDADGDGYGDADDATLACEAPSGTIATGEDCDDTSGFVNPDASEICDGIDNDCDDETDEDSAVDASTWYTDADGDGYGDPLVFAPACDAPLDGVAFGDDCDDTDAAVNIDADEVCDGVDNDCDDTIDESAAVDATTWYGDDDGDGYGADIPVIVSCEAPIGFVAEPGDCDDTNADHNPEGTEVCDGDDDDCDGTIDEADAIDASTWYADADSDGFGDAESTTEACDPPLGYTFDDTDCDDTASSTFPGAEEVWYDGVDADCDGGSDHDADSDGWDAESAGVDPFDCDDADAGVNPDAEDVWYDGVDADCDGAGDYDADADGVDSDLYGGDDCDDADAATYPGAPDTPYDGVITDCEHSSDYDVDGDGYDSSDHGGDDCDDGSASVNPAGVEVWYDGIDQDCDSNDGDRDADGYDGTPGVGDDCDDGDASVHPGAVDTASDGIDQDCDGSDGGTTLVYTGGGLACATPRSGRAPHALWLTLPLLLVARRREERS